LSMGNTAYWAHVRLAGAGIDNARFDSPCVADFNCSWSVSAQDLFDFLAAWFAGATRANVNGVAGVSVQDIFDFLSRWFAGC
jgi:hypothetical protein